MPLNYIFVIYIYIFLLVQGLKTQGHCCEVQINGAYKKARKRKHGSKFIVTAGHVHWINKLHPSADLQLFSMGNIKVELDIFTRKR